MRHAVFICSEEPNSTTALFFTSPWCVENVPSRSSSNVLTGFILSLRFKTWLRGWWTIGVPTAWLPWLWWKLLFKSPPSPVGRFAKTQGIVGCTPIPTYPYGKSLYKPHIMVCMGYNPQESLENTLNTMGTLLGVHSIVPWKTKKKHPEFIQKPQVATVFFRFFHNTWRESEEFGFFFLKKKMVVQVLPFFIKSKELNGAVNDNMTFPNWIVSCQVRPVRVTTFAGLEQFRIRLLGSNPDPFKSGYCLFWWSKKHPSLYRLSNPCHFFKFAKCFTAKSRTWPREVTVNL